MGGCGKGGRLEDGGRCVRECFDEKTHNASGEELKNAFLHVACVSRVLCKCMRAKVRGAEGVACMVVVNVGD